MDLTKRYAQGDDDRPLTPGQQLLEEVRAMRAEQAALRRVFDEFAGAYLNARFPFGKATDRWPRR